MQSIIQKIKGQFALSLFAVFAVAAMAAPQAHAVTAAGSVLTNSVTVDYTDAGGNAQPQLTTSVDVTVAYVGNIALSAPVPATQTLDSGSVAVDYVMQLTNNGNGSDTVTMTGNAPAVIAGTFLTNGTWALPAPITLFGTVSTGVGVVSGVAPALITTIPVASAGSVAVAGTTVIIGGSPFVVDAASTATSLVVVGDATVGTATAGVQIGQQIAVPLSNSVAATLNTTAPTGTLQHTVVATGTAGGIVNVTAGAIAPTAQQLIDTVYNNAVLSVTKYVRNVTAAAGNAAGTTPTVINGQTYFLTGVTGAPGDVLEYAVVISNDPAAGTAKAVVLTDTLPALTSYNLNSLSLDPYTGVFTPLTDVYTDADAGQYNGLSGLTVFAGFNGAGNATTYGSGTGGQLSGGQSSTVIYQVTIQ